MNYKYEHDDLFSDNAKIVANQKYASYEDESICQIFDRVSQDLAKVTSKYSNFRPLVNDVVYSEKCKEFYYVMANKQFMPAGRTLTNAGTGRGIIANCVVLGIEDSMDSISETLRDAILLQKQGCGIGFNFSNLRPAGSPVKSEEKSQGIASGPISFMRMYNDCFSTIKQQGRSGANMGMLDIYHPDIYSFISCKEVEGDLTTFNISVVIPDEFMSNLNQDPNQPFICNFNGVKYLPRKITSVRSKFGLSEEVEELEITYQDIWDRLCTFAHSNGEPGVMFVDTVNETNPVPGLGKIVASNPCITEDAWVHTNKGARQVRELIGEPFTAVVNGKKYKTTSKGFFYSDEKPVYQLRTKEGFTLDLTKDHKVKTNRGMIPANELVEGDLIALNNNRSSCNWGTTHDAKSAYDYAFDKPPYALTVANKNEIQRKSSRFYREFLKALFDKANLTFLGREDEYPDIKIWRHSLEDIRFLQRMLLRLGIYSFIESRPMSNTTGYYLIVSGEDLLIYLEQVGLSDTKRVKTLQKELDKFTLKPTKFFATFSSLRYIKTAKVYDCTIERLHKFDANGLIVANCGEQQLHSNDNCNLGSLNVHAFYDYETNSIDYEEMKRVIFIAIEMLDNTIDLFNHDVQAINEMARDNRRVGLGIMGFADLLVVMGIEYGTTECLRLIDELGSFISETTKEASLALAKERGTFWNIQQSVFAQEDGFIEEDEAYRNCALTSIAPTGSISMICDVNGGIEPFFSLAYTKSTRSGDLTYIPNSIVKQIQNFDISQQFKSDLIEAIKQGNDFDKLLDIFEQHRGTETELHKVFNFVCALVTSMEIEPSRHVDVQARFQKYIDNSISKTINLPNNAIVEDVSDLYKKAWDENCKSITVYRDGSRDMQILEKIDSEVETSGQKEEEKTYVMQDNRIPRPSVVDGKTYKIQTSSGTLYLTINCWKDDNGVLKPFEVFALVGKEGGDLSAYMSALTRMISLALRSGVGVDKVVEQLKGIGSSTFWDKGVRNEGVVDAIAQALEKFISVEENSEAGYTMQINEVLASAENTTATAYSISYTLETCHLCGGKLVMQEGCKACPGCGWSQC